MAELTLKAPEASLTSPTTWYKTRAGLEEQLKKSWDKYGKDIKDIAELTKVPAQMILGFLQVESGGNPTAGSGDIIGLMQWNRKYAGGKGNKGTTLAKEFNAKRLSPAEIDEFKKYGITFDSEGGTRAITVADQKTPRLNILIGAIILGQLLDESWATENGNVRLDRVIARYNIGGTALTKYGVGTKTLSQVRSAVPAVTTTYIDKMLGKNGALDIIKNEMKNSVK